MNHKEKMGELGLLGEKIIMNYLSAKGYIVHQSIDKYDSEKDILVNGQKVEVKTQVPFIIENSFTILPTQLTKCRNVSFLYFISVPANTMADKWAGWIFEVNPKTFVTKTRKTKDGRNMILIPRNQEAVKPVEKLDENTIKHLITYTVSEY